MAPLKGMFKCKNPQKYAKDPKNIVYRSSWELKFFRWLDDNPKVTRWGSEEFHIPYSDPTSKRKDGSPSLRRYFPDVIVEIEENGKKRILVIEIKPKVQTLPPKQSKNQKKMISEALVYAKNLAKWQAAKRWCDQKGFEFKILTEIELGIPSYG